MKSERTWMSFRTEWLNKLWLIHSMGCYAPIKKSKLRISVDLERGLGCIIKNESQGARNAHIMVSFLQRHGDHPPPPKKFELKGYKCIYKAANFGHLENRGFTNFFIFVSRKNDHFKTKWKFGNIEHIKESKSTWHLLSILLVCVYMWLALDN